MIDILLSTYNGEKYLNEQIESILNQTYTDWKLLIRDDDSDDNTLHIVDAYCKNYPQKVVKVLDNGAKVGVIRSFEILLHQSQSEYIMFCDQDDVWLPQKIEDAINKIINVEKEQPDKPIIICSDLYVTDDVLNKISVSFFEYTRINLFYLQKVRELSVNNYVTGCTMLFNKKAKEISLPFGKNVVMYDFWIALKVLSFNGLIVISEKTEILYRQHDKNVVGAAELKYNHKYFLLKILNIKQVIVKNYLNYKQAKEIFNLPLHVFIYERIKYLLKR